MAVRENAAEVQRVLDAKDYYAVLGIEKGETNESLIRRKYIQISRAIHPDKNGNDPETTQAFQKLSNAYCTLKDPSSRRIYDLGGAGANVNAEEALSELMEQLYKEFVAGHFEEILRVIDQVNAQSPETQLDRESVRELLERSHEVFHSVDSAYKFVKPDLLEFSAAYQQMGQLSYLNVLGRAAFIFELWIIILGVPLKTEKLHWILENTINLIIFQLELARDTCRGANNMFSAAASGLFGSWESEAEVTNY
eukprot:Clim_evm44s243 gene=Clim_evmTU44s243